MRKILIPLFASSAVAIAAVAVVVQQSGWRLPSFVQQTSQYLDVDRAESDEAGEDALDSDFWIARNTYPTGHFDQRWTIEAAQHERAMVAAVPAGVRSYDKSTNAINSPLALDPGVFVPLGPMPENNTQQGFGHVSGRSNVIKVDPTTTTPGAITVYSGSDGGGIWKTTNCCTANTQWQIVTDIPEISGMSISDIAIDPNDHNTIYAGTGDLNYGAFSFGAAGVLKSTDAGQSWQVFGTDIFSPYYSGSANSFPQYQAVGKVAVDPNNSSIVMAGSKTGLYISHDGGNNWSGPCYTNPFATGATPQRQDVTGLIPVSNGDSTTRVYVAIGVRGSPTPVQPDLGNTGSNGIYKLAAIPASGCPLVGDWTLLNSGWPATLGNGVAGANQIGRIEIAVAPSNPQRMYAEAADITTKKINSFYRSNDAGATWTQTSTGAGLNNNGSNPGCEANSNNGGGQMWYDAGLTVDPNNPDRVWMSTIDATVSSDGGLNYYDVTCGYGSHSVNGGTRVHVDHHARAFVGNDSTQMLLGSDGGVYYSANADVAVTSSTANNTMTWIGMNDTINSTEFYFGDLTANFSTAATPAIGAGAQDNGCMRAAFTGTPTGPVLWTSNCSGDGTTTKIEPVNGVIWFNSSQNGSLARSTNGGVSGFATASASTGGTWGGDPVSAIFAMSYDIYRWGVLDAPGSGCSTASGCNHMIAGTTRLWETVDMTNPTIATMRSSWKARTVNLTKNNLILGSDNRSFINYVAYSFSDPTVAGVATNDGNVQLIFGLGTAASANCVTPGSDLNCATTVNVTGGNTILPNRPIFGIRFDPNNALVAYAAVGGFNQNTPATPGHVFQVTCSAYNCPSFTWLDKTGNLPNIPVEQVMPNPNRPNQVFAGTDWGLYYTNDISVSSPTWYRFEQFPHLMIWELGVDRGFTTLVAYTRSRGAWVWPLTTGAAGSGPDLSVSVSAPTNVNFGDTLTYTVTVTNVGSVTSTGAQVVSALPPGTTFAGNSGDCVTGYPCAFPTINAGETKTITTRLCVPSRVASYSGTNPVSTGASASSGNSDIDLSNNAGVGSTLLPTDIVFHDGFESCQ